MIKRIRVICSVISECERRIKEIGEREVTKAELKELEELERRIRKYKKRLRRVIKYDVLGWKGKVAVVTGVSPLTITSAAEQLLAQQPELLKALNKEEWKKGVVVTSKGKRRVCTKYSEVDVNSIDNIFVKAWHVKEVI